MAIPNNYIDKITDNDNGESRLICPPAEHVRVENENFEGTDLDEVLDEISEGIGEAGQINEIIMNGQHYTPENKVIDLGTVITQHQDISGKADKATTYTKTETDNAIANAVEGLGGGSVESVTINGVNHEPINGVVDLGTIQGQPGAQGPAGNTYLVDENFDPVSMIINNLDESDGTVALSARQGKILKQNVEALWTKVNALINDLAAMAFTGAKTQGLGNIDWTGGTFYATINKSLTGCTATDNTTNGQIAEGSTLTMQLTASSGYTLTGATISVTDSRGQAVAYTLNGNTLTVANVVGTINISVVAKAVHQVSLGSGSSHVSFASGTTTEAVDGSSWSGTIEADSGDSGYTLPSQITVTMGGSQISPSYNASTGAISIDSVTGAVVITAVAEEMGRVALTKQCEYGQISDSGAPHAGSAYQSTITPDADFGLKSANVVVKIDGTTAIEGTDYTLSINQSTYVGTLNVPTTSATQSIEVSVKCAVLLYKGYYTSSNGEKVADTRGAGSSPSVCTNVGILPLGGTATSSSVVRITSLLNGVMMTSSYTSVQFYEGTTKKTYYSVNKDTKDISGNEGYIVGADGLVCTFNADNLSNCYIHHYPNGTSGDHVVVFDGSDTDSYILVE